MFYDKRKFSLSTLTNISINKKLLMSFAVVLLITVMATTYAISSLKKSEKLSEELYTGPYQATNHAMGIRRDLLSIGRYIYKSVLENDGVRYKSTIESEFDSFYERIEKLKETSDGSNGLIDEVVNSMERLRTRYEYICNLIEKGEAEKAVDSVNSADFNNIFSNAAQQVTDIYERAQGYGEEFNTEIKDVSSKAMLISILISLASIILGVFIAIKVAKQIKKPISKIEIAANKMALGEYDFDIQYDANDELGSLAESMRQVSYSTGEMITDIVHVLSEVAQGNFNVETKVEYVGVYENIKNSLTQITEDLSETMLQINMASEEVGAASDQVSSGAQMLSQGAAEQASAIEELSSTIIEVSNKIKESASNAQKANVLSISVGNDIKNGNEQMEDMINAMMEISNTSNEISRIIKTIDDIAFQTNILALNAAVEAARAGESGKGFAVVADEVRNLAAKSAEAASNTAALIEKSINAVEAGNGKVANTAMSLQKIIESTNQTIKLIDSIASSSDEQANATGQITLGIEQISSVVQINSATAEESAAASEELSAQAQTLKSRIENFKLKKESNHNKKISFIEEV